jgi:alpha-ketoglutarate-dependent taurine dioxygenase
MAYNSYWPMHVLFFCQQPPEDGGATTICDARRFYRLLDPSLLDGFHRRGLRYVRNFTKEMPYKTIEETFGTTDRQQIREFCRQNHMQVEWHDDDRLSLVQDAPAVRYHPITGAPIFFNTLVLWHVSYWSKLLGAFRDNGAKVDETTLWGNSLYGDGTAIEDSVVATILGKYEEQERQILWQKGDIMYFDNMLASHGRMPFAGKRSILASFRTPTRAADLRATDGLRT